MFTNRKIGARTINRTNVVYRIKEQENKALTKKRNKKEINLLAPEVYNKILADPVRKM
jgi:hypothetical protein